MEERKLQALENKVLRKLFGPYRDKKTWATYDII
jgi:hypothetical protein